MTADDGIGTRIDHHAGQLALARAREGLVLPAPVHHRDHDVGAMQRPRCRDVEAHLVVLAPRHAGLVVIGLEAARQELVVAEQRDAQSLAFDDQRRVRTREVATTAEVRDAALFEQSEHFAEGLRSVVARMIVRERDGVEVALQHAERAGVRAERVGLAGLGRARRRDDAFEIADADVGRVEDLRERCERIAPATDRAAGQRVEHHVADERDRHGGVRRCVPGVHEA